MSDQPTPETDALITLRSGFGVTDYEWRQHSRKLERQRDAAISRFKGSQSARMKLKRERDEAREELINLRVENDHNWQANADLEEMIKLARQLRDALVSACRFVDCYESESAAAIDDKWATARKCNAALIKAKEALP